VITVYLHKPGQISPHEARRVPLHVCGISHSAETVGVWIEGLNRARLLTPGFPSVPRM